MKTTKTLLLNERIERLTAPDGYELRYRRYFQPKAMASVVYLAGIESHGGWYQASSAALFSNGFNVYFLDRRGSGLNSTHRGDLTRFRILFSDLDQLIQKVKEETSAKPVHLVALSWGAKWAMGWCLERPSPEVASLTLITPGLVSRVGYSAKQMAAVAWASVLFPRKLFPIPIQPEMFTGHPKWQAFIRQDSLRLKKVTARFLREGFFLDRFIRQSKRRVPVRAKLFLAGRDAIIDNDASRILFIQRTTPEREIQVYPDAVHTLEFEANREEFFRDLVEWIKQKA